MSREWKPGDVAMTQYGRAFYSGDDARGSWTFDDGSGGFDPRFRPLQAEAPRDARPLVVIDPEDREQIGRLLSTIRPGAMGGLDNLQRALREFADPKPPKPDEPTGLGAVVEDGRGERFVIDFVHDDGKPRWYGPKTTRGADVFGYFEWADIDAVRVLSEGVTS